MDQKIINQFLELNKLKFSNYKTNDNILIVDRGRIDPIIRSSIVAEIYNKKKKINVIVLKEYNNKKWHHEIYSSFNPKKILSIPSLKQFYRYPYIFLKSLYLFVVKYLYFLIFRDFNWFINNFKILDTHFGDLIYDSYLRYGLKFLVKSKLDYDFIKILFITIYKANYINYIIKKYSIKQIIVNSATYVQNSSIALRIGVKNNIPSVFVAWFVLVFYDDYKRLFISRQKVKLKDIESCNLPDNWFELYEKYTKDRYLGKIDHPEFINAFKNKITINPSELFSALSVDESEFEKIVLIAPHAFSDASHESFDNLFDDFYDHFISTLNHIKESRHLDNVLWLVNPHPSSGDYGEEGLVAKIIEKYNSRNIRLFPKHINTYSALKIVDTVITCNGTIGMEFPACFEKRSLIAGDAPYSGNGFNIEPKTKNEYFKAIDNIKNIEPLTEEQKILAKKTFFFSECMLLESNITSIIPSNRFLNPSKFLDHINQKLKLKDFKNDPYYNQLEDKISEKLIMKK